MPNRLLEISGEITPERMKTFVQETKCNHNILLDIVCYLNNIYSHNKNSDYVTNTFESGPNKAPPARRH